MAQNDSPKDKTPDAPATTLPSKTRYRLKAGAKLVVTGRDEDGQVKKATAGDVVELTPAQAKAFADRIEPLK